MRDFRRLDVWQSAREFTADVYRVTRTFPREEVFGLTGQLRRAAMSIGANIAEGAGRSSDKDYARFIRYAAGSANEAEHHIILANDLGLLGDEDSSRLAQTATTIRAMLTRFHQRLSSRQT
jgi:four helix bundle protein